jgi:hypothetical protein
VITLRPTYELTALGIALALTAGCSSPPEQPGNAVADAGTDAGVTHAPIDPNRMIGALTDDEWAKMCDWEAERLGGYGHGPDCDANFTVMAPRDQTTCVAAVRITFPCDLIVSDFEACIDERVEYPCALSFPACEPIGACHDAPDARPE